MKTKPVFQHNKLFIFGDLHGFHSNICQGSSKWTDKSCCRPFENAAEMTSKVIDNINETVPEDGVLLHLGDFLFGDKSRLEELRNRIICKKIIHLYGNHDDYMLDYRNHEVVDRVFVHADYYMEFYIQYPDKQQMCVAFHYPILSWNKVRKGSWMIHGHCHGNLQVKFGKMIDVGLETNNYYPYSCSKLRSILDPIPIKSVDSHH